MAHLNCRISLIGPYLILVFFGWKRGGRKKKVDAVARWLVLFALWALPTTLLIRERYEYGTDGPTIVGLIKLGRMVVYGTAGILTAPRSPRNGRVDISDGRCWRLAWSCPSVWSHSATWAKST